MYSQKNRVFNYRERGLLLWCNRFLDRIKGVIATKKLMADVKMFKWHFLVSLVGMCVQNVTEIECYVQDLKPFYVD